MKVKSSMSRTGCCDDNAPPPRPPGLGPFRKRMDRFLSIHGELLPYPQVELVHQRRWATRNEARRDLFATIEGYYNRQRIHSALGYITPEQVERKAS